MNCNDEVTIKIVGKLSIKFPTMDQLEVRRIVEEVLYRYNVLPQEKSIVKSDIKEKIAMYLSVKKMDGLSKLTLKGYQLHLLRFSSYICKPIATVTTADIRMYLIKVTQGKKSTTLSTEVSILKSFFSWLVDEEIIPKNPCRRIKQPKIGERLRKALTVEELERLRDACKTVRQRAILEFLFSTGCRLSELVSVNTFDLNWGELSLHVIGKGNKERIVYFSPKAKLYIKKYLKSRTDSNPALFVSSKHPYQRLKNRSVEKEIAKIAENAGFDKAVFPHLLRHTMATLALQSGAALTTVQKLLGHKDPATTEIYSEIDNETVKEEYRKHLIQ